MRRSERYRRPFDLALVALALAVLLPLWLLLAIAIALAIRFEDGGPVVYHQARLGLGGRVFQMLKFRSMMVGAEAESGPVWAAPGDARSTAVGRVLRRFHLDELPQVVNVVRGEMSLVGPRPERPELAARIETRLPDFRKRLQVRPGIAGLAQSRGGHGMPARHKLRYDLVYVGAMGPWLDLKLLARCLWVALVGPGRSGGARSGWRHRRPGGVAGRMEGGGSRPAARQVGEHRLQPAPGPAHFGERQPGEAPVRERGVREGGRPVDRRGRGGRPGRQLKQEDGKDRQGGSAQKPGGQPHGGGRPEGGPEAREVPGEQPPPG